MTGIIDVGGANRAVFADGVFDSLLDNDIILDYCIGVSAGVSPITGLKYNGQALTAEDVSEATTCGLSAGYFVRWVAADLVLAGDNSCRSQDHFTLSASGYKDTTYKLRIVEPSDD